MSLHPVPSRFVTREELAEELRCSTRTIDRMKAEGMPYVSWGRRMTRYDVSEVLAWAEGQNRRAA